MRLRAGNRLVLAFAAVTLGAASLGCARKTEDAETRRRSQWVHDIAFREDAGRTYLLTTRDDVHFGDGWYPCEHHPIGDVRADSWRWMGSRAIIKLEAGDRAPRKLVAAGWMPEALGKATLTFTVDGVPLASLVVQGGYRLEIVVPSSMLDRPWVDLAMNASAVWTPPNDGRELGAALNELRWERL